VIAALELADVAVVLAGRTVIEAVSLTVAPGELVGVLGANGCGKTTLLRAALGLVALSTGEARLANRAVGGLSEAERASRAGYLPQERRIGWNLPAWRVAALGVPQQPPARAREIAMGALAEVAMTSLAERGVLDMSGGERARVLLARLIATGAPLLVADEPAAGLDPAAQLLVMELLRARVAAGAAVLVTLHDLTLAARGCDRLAVMAAGRLIALGPPRQALAPDILAAAFALDGALMETRAGPVIAARRVIP
jgi:iron complex transport system ATP-binding protein